LGKSRKWVVRFLLNEENLRVFVVVGIGGIEG
jgi:hypothetical protein